VAGSAVVQQWAARRGRAMNQTILFIYAILELLERLLDVVIALHDLLSRF
jgi:hypothetical protein